MIICYINFYNLYIEHKFGDLILIQVNNIKIILLFF